MDKYTATEQAFKHGYEKGYEDGKKAVAYKWISTEDRLPERFQPVIICRKNGEVGHGHRDFNGWWKVYGTRVKAVTHWMPWPEPPKEC